MCGGLYLGNQVRPQYVRKSYAHRKIEILSDINKNNYDYAEISNYASLHFISLHLPCNRVS